MRAARLLALGVLLLACHRGRAESDLDRCTKAKAVARDAWSSLLPGYKAAAEDARAAASNCDGPTRNAPPCSGQMSERFMVQSVTSAKALEVERAFDSTTDGGALAMREAASLVKDDPKVQSAKAASTAAFEACRDIEP